MADRTYYRFYPKFNLGKAGHAAKRSRSPEPSSGQAITRSRVMNKSGSGSGRSRRAVARSVAPASERAEIARRERCEERIGAGSTANSPAAPKPLRAGGGSLNPTGDGQTCTTKTRACVRHGVWQKWEFALNGDEFSQPRCEHWLEHLGTTSRAHVFLNRRRHPRLKRCNISG